MASDVAPAAPAAPASGQPWPRFGEALAVWVRVAVLSFGGPAGQISMMHRILVEEKRWLGDARFLHALNFCMLLPGPEAQQLTVYIGWLMHRTAGGIAAGVLFVLPGTITIMGLSIVYALYGDIAFVTAIFFGLKAAVLAIVLQALTRIATRVLRNPARIVIAAASFVAIFLFDAPFPAIILAASLFGYLAGRAGSKAFVANGSHNAVGGKPIVDADTILGHGIPDHARPDGRWSLKVGAVLLALWLAPTVALIAVLGFDHVFTDIALFFSRMAVVTFGGAYAVLAYVAQAAVESYGWLEPGEMLDGLGMAETTPGPLIMVTQFVGFMGAFREPGSLSPLLAGVLGGALTTWVTFAPCFLWIFLGAPHAEKLRGDRALSAALAAITAAVVGVVLNLAIWFAMHVVFRDVMTFEGWGLDVSVPTLASLDPAALALSASALVAVFRFNTNLLLLLALAAIMGPALYVIGIDVR